MKKFNSCGWTTIHLLRQACFFVYQTQPFFSELDLRDCTLWQHIYTISARCCSSTWSTNDYLSPMFQKIQTQAAVTHTHTHRHTHTTRKQILGLHMHTSWLDDDWQCHVQLSFSSPSFKVISTCHIHEVQIGSCRSCFSAFMQPNSATAPHAQCTFMLVLRMGVYTCVCVCVCARAPLSNTIRGLANLHAEGIHTEVLSYIAMSMFYGHVMLKMYMVTYGTCTQIYAYACVCEHTCNSRLPLVLA